MKTDKMSVIMGGPSYRMEVDARHCCAMMALSAALYNSGLCSGIQPLYEDGCPVERVRNSIFAKALESDATHLFWADSDVYWEDSGELVWGLQELARLGMPCLIVPVVQRGNGDINIIMSPPPELERPKGKFPIGRHWLACWAGGMGLAMFYLPWYRENWRRGPWFKTEWATIPAKPEPKTLLISEDIWHTSHLRVAPLWAPLTVTYHATRVESVLSTDDGAL
jgi:hypothetical protein